MTLSLARAINPSLTATRLRRMLPPPARGIAIVLAEPGKSVREFALEEKLAKIIQMVRINENDHSLGERIKKACHLALGCHARQIRQSGEPYIFHPLEVAEIVAKWGLGEGSVIAALLHDVSEDAGMTREEIRNIFGKDVAKMVAGVTELGKEPEYKGGKPSAIDKYRKWLEFGSENPNILFIKLADRLHNMRTLEYMDPVKRARKAEETLNVYGKIADILGMWDLKRELEDLSFQYLEPEEYERIKMVRERVAGASGKRVVELRDNLRKEFDTARGGPGVAIEQRGVYELYERMQKREFVLEQVKPSDIWRFQIIVRAENDCYLMLKKIHKMFRPNQGELRDYIGDPRPNHHEFLHTVVTVPGLGGLLIQIRDRVMYDNYRLGVLSPHTKGKHDKLWLSLLIDYLREEGASEEELGRMIGALSASVSVSGAGGEKVRMPMGTTVLDYVFQVHRSSFFYVKEALINGRSAPLSQTLRDGDSIEIITDGNVCAKLEWIDWLRMSAPRKALRAYLMEASQLETYRSAMAYLDGETTKYFLPARELLETEFAKRFLADKGFRSVDDFMHELGTGGVRKEEMARSFMEFYREKLKESEGTVREYAVRIETADHVALLNSITGPLAGLSINLSGVYSDTVAGNGENKKAILILKIEGAAGEVGWVQYLQVNQIIESAVGSGSFRFIQTDAADKMLEEMARKRKKTKS